MKQRTPYCNLVDVLHILGDVVLKYHNKQTPLNWQNEPTEVIEKLFKIAEQIGDQIIVPYNGVMEIFECARSPKLGGNMNRGLGEIREKIKQIRFTKEKQ